MLPTPPSPLILSHRERTITPAQESAVCFIGSNQLSPSPHGRGRGEGAINPTQRKGGMFHVEHSLAYFTNSCPTQSPRCFASPPLIRGVKGIHPFGWTPPLLRGAGGGHCSMWNISFLSMKPDLPLWLLRFVHHVSQRNKHGFEILIVFAFQFIQSLCQFLM